MRRSTLFIAGFALLSRALASCGTFSSEAVTASNGPDADTDALPMVSEAAAPTGSCSDPLTEGWSPPERLSNLRGSNGEVTFVDPFVSADGLTLLVVNASGAPLRVYRATRSTRGADWSTAVELVGLSNQTYAPPYPSSAAPSAEILLAAEGSQTDIFEGLFLDGGWSKQRIDSLVRPDVDMWPTVSADGLLLVYQQRNANQDNPFRVLFQSTRSAPNPEAAWSGPTALVSPPFDGGPNDVAWSHPALTPDGLGLFYSVESRKGVVELAARRTRTESFFADGGAGAEVPAFRSDGYTSYVRSVTADGCEAYLTSDRGGALDVYVAKRLR